MSAAIAGIYSLWFPCGVIYFLGRWADGLSNVFTLVSWMRRLFHISGVTLIEPGSFMLVILCSYLTSI